MTAMPWIPHCCYHVGSPRIKNVCLIRDSIYIVSPTLDGLLALIVGKRGGKKSGSARTLS